MCFVLLFNLGHSQIVINEICTNNDTILFDSDGDSPDWIELVNYTPDQINLGEYFLSDNRGYLEKWKFSDSIIQPYQIVIVYASGKDYQNNEEIHTNFKLSSNGEALFLTNDDHEIIDSLTFGWSYKNYAFARLPDYTGVFRNCQLATPGYPNTSRPHVFITQESGFYSSDVDIDFETFGMPSVLRYTTDGSEPTSTSNIYTNTIKLSNAYFTQDSIALIPTTPMEGPERLDEIIWKEPTMQCRRMHIIRYALFQDTNRISDIKSNSFYIHDDSTALHNIPIVSIGVNKNSLFDYESGIYIPGKRFDNTPWSYWPYGNYNYKGKQWERRINFEYFDTKSEVLFNDMAGMRIHGRSSASLAQKSFKLYFRKEYGQSKFEGQIFSDEKCNEFKRLIFRNGGNDLLKLHFRDAFMQCLLEPIDIETQLFQPSAVYINGEYWGLHNIRQRFEPHYFEINHGVPEDSLIVWGSCGYRIEGNSGEYNQVINFIKDNDLSAQSNYEFVAGKIDIDNCIQYYLANIYFANGDWPGNNYKIWKSTDSSSKWRWLVYDLDFSYAFHSRSKVYRNSLEDATLEGGNEWPNPDCSTLLLRNLLLNNEFKTKFIQTFNIQLNTIFKPINVISKIDSIVQLYETEMLMQIDRWHYPRSMSKWYNEIEVIKEFAELRPSYLREYFRDFFGSTFYDSIINVNDVYVDNFEYSVYPNPCSTGSIKVNLNQMSNLNSAVYIINCMGVKVYEQKIGNHSGILSINVANFPKGVYIISVIDNVSDSRKKIVIN